MYQQPFSQGGGQPAPQVPFDPTRLTSPMLNISLNNPPHVPRLPVDPQMQHYVPLIAAMAALEIQQRSQSNPLRIFMFNMYSQNNFANAEFDSLVAAAVDFVMLQMSKRAFGNIEMAVQDSVPKVVEMICAMNLRIFPGLAQYVDGHFQAAAQQTIGFFDSTAQEIQQMKRMMQGGQPAGYGGYTNQQPAYGGHAYTQQQPYAAPSMMSSGGGARLFSGSNRYGGPVDTPAATGRNMSSRYESNAEPLKQPFTPRKEIPVNTSENEPLAPATLPTPLPLHTPGVEVLASSGQIKWRPSVNYPYFPAYDPTLYDLYFSLDEQGDVIPTLKHKAETNMDYDRHATATVFGTPPRALDLQNTTRVVERVQQGIDLMNGQAKSRPTEINEEQKASQVTKFDWTMDTSEQNVWLTAGLDRLVVKTPEGETPDVYRVFSQLSDPVISDKDESAVVGNFGSSRSYMELREKMNSAVNEMSPGLWGAINLKMTKTINRILRQNLSLPKLYIESFVTDLQDLLDALKDLYGPVVEEAFLRYQRSTIDAALGLTLKGDTAEQMTGMLFEDRDFKDTKPSITYLCSRVSFTLLNCRAYELNLELSHDGAAAIKEKLTPMMHSLLDSLFKDPMVLDNNFDRHLIRTNDGRVMEATKGHIGADYYLLTLIE